MGYTSCKADPDLWYKAETRPTDNFRYYVVELGRDVPFISFAYAIWAAPLEKPDELWMFVVFTCGIWAVPLA